jgi:hypothetical protein
MVKSACFTPAAASGYIHGSLSSENQVSYRMDEAENVENPYNFW